MKLNLATILTLVRIAAIPVIVACFYWKAPYARPLAGILFGIAAITDLIDGYIARNYGQMSRFGAFLDPVADKLMVTIAMILLVQSDPKWQIDFLAMIIIGREITISALREWMATVGARDTVAVGWPGKVKTTLQMFGIAFMVYQEEFLGFDVYGIGFVLLVVAAGMTLWSMFGYLKAAWPSMQAGAEEGGSGA
ncbi:MAG: CDP-diacylglycerol--glycerol-3-phosphate 3-phosphatidyltransferase [Gammaproteobacteria bacterium]|nr:CDP-diacylglycerol--glycerol-3-phosphate 3-phosphatidyltransferase [Gammaproteobacteria bacterium]MDH4254868.1 CDP-diacylglycerol--glycerol-3-phosphate 3-phosphatidyltransferase [Gammaproteobacteria bacterium]MDH5310200.1 CDP-diacylglycerol--glycerol-3-phosphate 3-phosphatidyltransferase [Gammaproteobacteria bacterium]